MMDENDKALPAQAPAGEGALRGEAARDPGGPHEYDTDAQNLGDFKQETTSPKPNGGNDGAKGGMR